MFKFNPLKRDGTVQERPKKRKPFEATTVDYLKKWCAEHGNLYPSKEERDEIMAATGMTGSQLTGWLANERKKQNKPSVAPLKANRFPDSVLDCLNEWYDEHQSYPYPTREEKDQLKSATGLSEQQIDSWLYRERKLQRDDGVEVKSKNRFSSDTTNILKEWYDKHASNPYPSEEKKAELANATKITEAQVNNWFHKERQARKKSSGNEATEFRRNHPKEALDHLSKWFDEHESNPYPTQEEKAEMASITGLSEYQISRWFIHQRMAQNQSAEGLDPISRSAIKHLEKWYADHKSDPSPTEKEVAEMASASGLSKEEINKWFEQKRKTKKQIANCEFLRKWFAGRDLYPTKEERLEVMSATGMTYEQVGAWLNNERTRQRIASGVPPAKGNDPFSDSVVTLLKKWCAEHDLHPTQEEKAELASATGLSQRQLTNWFSGERKRQEKQRTAEL